MAHKGFQMRLIISLRHLSRRISLDATVGNPALSTIAAIFSIRGVIALLTSPMMSFGSIALLIRMRPGACWMTGL